MIKINDGNLAGGKNFINDPVDTGLMTKTKINDNKLLFKKKKKTGPASLFKSIFMIVLYTSL